MTRSWSCAAFLIFSASCGSVPRGTPPGNPEIRADAAIRPADPATAPDGPVAPGVPDGSADSALAPPADGPASPLPPPAPSGDETLPACQRAVPVTGSAELAT